MRIGFVSLEKEDNILQWSGTVKFMYDNLKKIYPEIISINGLNLNPHIGFYFKKIYKKIIFRSDIESFRNEKILRDYGKQIDDFIEKNNIDIIFSPGAMHLAYITKNVRIITWVDATFDNLKHNKFWYKNYSNSEIVKIEELEKLAFNKVTKIICATKWVSDSLVNNYKIDETKIAIIPFGANLNQRIDEDTINCAIENKLESNTLNLLFIGREPKLKGLDKVLETTKVINEIGIKLNLVCNLNIIGCEPKIRKDLSQNVTVVGFLNKSKKEENEKLLNYFLNSHFLFLPSQFEAFGLVYAESASYGLPSIGNKLCGVQYLIKNGVNGYLLEKEEKPEEIAKFIIEKFNNKIDYKKLCLSSFEEYNNNLNWNASFKKLKLIIDSLNIK